MTTGSEIFETGVMKADEVVLFVEVAKANGSDLEEAYNDMRMIDALLHAERIHLLSAGSVRKTARGFYRKGSDVYTTMDRIVDAWGEI